MVLATAHVTAGIGLSLLISQYWKLPKRCFFLAALGALTPDFDFLPALIFRDLGWHRAHLNVWFIPFVISAVGWIVLPKYRKEVSLFSVGYLSHLILDLFNASLLTLALIDGVVVTLLVILFLVKYWKVE